MELYTSKKKDFMKVLNASFSTLLVVICSSIMAQAPLKYFNTNDTHCGTDAYTEEYFQAHPEKRIEFSDNSRAIFERARHTSARGNEKFIIPVVVHIVHDNGLGNINLEQVQDAIDILNEDYERFNADANETREEFKPFALGAPFEFRLARFDPNGDPTDGVVRINNPSKTYNMRNDVKSVSYWNSRYYFNMWLVNSIQSSSGGTVLGYAQFPGSGSWSTYGLVMRHDQFGRIGTSVADGRTLTHEMGHCLGLYHTFQSGCGTRCYDRGDEICDTPPSSSPTYNCNFNQNTCSTDENGNKIDFVVGVGGDTIRVDTIELEKDYPDQIENYMSYDACQNMFTRGQVNVMLEVVKSYSRLVDLTSDNNLDATGVSQLYSADFEADRLMVCTGEEVKYKDKSAYGPESWFWVLAGATPEMPTGESVSVKYKSPGLYSARLSVSNGLITKIKNKDNFIMVNPKDGYFFPDFEADFEDGLFPSAKWIAEDADLDGVTWEMNSQVGSSGTHSMKLNNFNSTQGDLDILYSSTYDLSVFQLAELSFSYASAEKFVSNNDRLIVSYSTDCGENWNSFWNVNTNNLATASPVSGSEFVPSSSDWTNVSQSLPLAAASSEDVQIRFSFISGGGNNFYIDDINITGVWKGKPTLNSPEIGEEVDAFKATLDWKSLDGVDEYEYQISETSDFSSILKSGKKSFIGISPDGLDTEVEINSLDRGKLYFWRVRGLNAGTPTDWSDEWFFRISQTVSQEEVFTIAPEMQVFPNPTSGLLNVRFVGTDESFKLEVRDLSGRLVLASSNEVSETSSIDVSNLVEGVYLVSASNSSSSFVKRFILRK